MRLYIYEIGDYVEEVVGAMTNATEFTRNVNMNIMSHERY